MSNKEQEDEIFFCLSDLSNIVSKCKKSIFSFALIFASICFFYVMLLSDVYQVNAKFSEEPEKKESYSVFEGIFSNRASSEKSQAIEIMQSKLIIKPVVEKLGLQASCYLKNKNLFFDTFKKYLKNLKNEFKLMKSDDMYFQFKNVIYSKEYTKTYYIYFNKNKDYKIFDVNKKLKKNGKLNELVKIDEIEFVLTKVPINLKINKPYILSFSPIESSIAKIKKNLKIQTSKFSNNVMNLTYRDNDPYLAQMTLNEIMDYYVKYLEIESLNFAKNQFEYLEKRKKEVSCSLEKSFDVHVKYLNKNLLKNGFMALEQEVQSLSKPHADCLKKIFALDLELSHIDVLEKNNSDFIFSDDLIGEKLAAIKNQKNKLNYKKNILCSSLFSQKNTADFLCKSVSKDNASKNIDDYFFNISNLKKEMKEIDYAIDQLKQNKKPDLVSIPFFNDNFKGEKYKKLTGQDLNNCFSQIKKALITQEKILKDRPIYAVESEKLFDGLDIETANELYISYNQKIDKVQAEIKHLQIILKDIEKDSFELSAVLPFFSDAISQKLIKQASDYQFKLNDEHNTGEKDKRRCSNEISLIRKFLKNHIEQMIIANQSIENLYKSKLYALQVATLDQTNQQISILDQQVKDFLALRKENILKEKVLLEKQVTTIREDMTSFPEKWKQEKLLKLESDTALKMIQSLTNLIETKTIDHHLKKIASKPIEKAIFPKSPKKKRAFFIFIVAFCVGVILAIFYFIIYTMYKGFNATIDNLNAMGEVTLGEISFACDGPKVEHIIDNDLETLRNIVHFSEPLLNAPGKILSLIGNNGPNYAYSLCNLYGRIGKKVLLIELNFQNLRSNKKGLTHYLDKNIKNIPISTFDNYDLLWTGATSRYGTEILRSLSFQEFIKEIKEKYDIIIAYGKVSPISAEAKAYLRFSDKVIVSFINETVQQLSTYYRKERKIGFLKVKP